MSIQHISSKRKWIDDASFVVMFDYNVTESEGDRYGRAWDWKEFDRYLAEVKPDCVFTQALGCFGWPSYESSVIPSLSGNHPRHTDRVTEACRRAGARLGLYVASFNYRSDGRKLSPAEMDRWAIVQADGSHYLYQFCSNSPWIEEYLVPFCLEAMERFQPAAFWFDGTYTLPCCCAHCRSRFREQYGRELQPAKNVNEEALQQKFKDRCAIEAMQRAARALYARDPDIVLGWGNVADTKTLRSAYEGLDWSCADEFNTPDLTWMEFDVTYRSTLGIPASLWMPDLARFDLIHPRQRPRALILSEAACLAAHGMGFAAYHLPPPDGLLGLHLRSQDTATAGFMRSRASFCLGNESVANVGIVASYANNLRYPGGRLQPMEYGLQATHEMISQSHVPCEVVNDDALARRLAGYGLVILGEVGVLAPDAAHRLETWVADGGRALLLGAAPVVAEPWDVKPDSPRLFGLTCADSGRTARHFDGERVAHLGPLLLTAAPVEVIWRRREVDGNEGEPLLVKQAWGKGEVWWLLARVVSEYAGDGQDTLGFGNLGGAREAIAGILQTPNYAGINPHLWRLEDSLVEVDYSGARPVRDLKRSLPHPDLRCLVGKAARTALGDRWQLRSDAPAGVEFVVNRRGADLYVHMVNHVFPFQTHGDLHKLNLPDQVPLLADVSFELRANIPASSIEAFPPGERISSERTVEGYRVTVPRLGAHMAVRFAGSGQHL